MRIDSEKGTKAKMTLTIDKCERNDLGEYTLTAANDLGSDSTSIKITIVGKSCFKKGLDMKNDGNSYFDHFDTFG